MEKKSGRDRDGEAGGGGGGALQTRDLPPPPPPHHGRGPLPPPPARSRLEPFDREKNFPPRGRPEPIDREKTCPLLLRVFTKIGGHHDREEFQERGKEPKDEVQIYTWKDATLRELTDLVKEVAPEARRRNARISFAFVYPDRNGRFVVRPVGETHSSARKPLDTRTLAELKFQADCWRAIAVMWIMVSESGCSGTAFGGFPSMVLFKRMPLSLSRLF
ncbi:hypothetical protein Tsubulata_002013 [Turnera subulata]|uniref:Histone deacetylase complex subunit SAP18 n=1 Tax=Turnera subulata TaxID=218843 RepID=A0A9Q0FIS6_9ROSI|nr:hypothetical protein Tsubulata_002013 [Turnera subulata]